MKNIIRIILKPFLGVYFLFGLFLPGLFAQENVRQNISARDVPLNQSLTIKQSLQLAGENMIQMLNADRNYLPYFRTTVRLGTYESNMAYWWPAHNIGRWWDAVLRLEESFGFNIPSHIEQAMLENVRAFFDNPDCIPLSPEKDPNGLDVVSKKLQWDIHSMREGFIALNALIKWRNDSWAAEMGQKMIASINEKLLDDGSWDLEKFDAYHKRGPFVIHNFDPCDTHGRMLEGLIWFYEQTNNAAAKRLADRVALWHFNNTTQADGTINPTCRADHTHSYLGTLRGLLLYGRLTNQPEYIKRVADAYRVNVPRIMKPSGYMSHNMVVESFGETTSPGDVAQLALWLYEDGYEEFVDDAETIVRARILPSQIRSTPPLVPFSCANGDMHVNLDERIIGGYGGCTVFPHAGKISVVDVSAADIHSLVDIYNHIAIPKDDTIEVLCHLDVENEHVKVTTEEHESQRTLRISLKKDKYLALRIPLWLDAGSIRFSVNDQVINPVIENHFALINLPTQESVATIHYELPKKKTTEVDLGVEYTIYWQGNNIVGVSPNQDFYPFYPNAPQTW